MIPTCDVTTMSKGISQARNNKVIAYDRPLHEDEKQSKVHPMKYGWIEKEYLLIDQAFQLYK